MGQQRDGGGRGRNWPLWDNKIKKIEFNWEFKIPAAHKPLKEPPFIYSIYKTKTPPPPFHRVANWLFSKRVINATDKTRNPSQVLLMPPGCFLLSRSLRETADSHFWRRSRTRRLNVSWWLQFGSCSHGRRQKWSKWQQDSAIFTVKSPSLYQSWWWNAWTLRAQSIQQVPLISCLNVVP